jgi:hypothetical protein
MARPKGEETVAKPVRLPVVLASRLDATATERGLTLNGAMVEAIRNWVDGEVQVQPRVDYAGHVQPEPVSISNLPQSSAGFGKDIGAFLSKMQNTAAPITERIEAADEALSMVDDKEEAAKASCLKRFGRQVQMANTAHPKSPIGKAWRANATWVSRLAWLESQMDGGDTGGA